MSVEIRVPPLGESVVEATVGQWTKSEGDAVRKDEILVELETDKITVEVAAPQDGVLGRVEKAEGANVGVNELLAVLEANGAAATDGGSAAKSDGAAAAPSASSQGQAPAAEDGAARTSPA